MPIFEYQCNQCKKEFEKLVFTGEDKNISCPECKSKDVGKKMSVSSFMGSNSLGKCATSSSKGFS
ncbi:MAG: zinc ribbon domain-containing protein [Desulfobacula sp.]|nr:zinc ribbon domain-containing protein [Desulfobacula sp.]